MCWIEALYFVHAQICKIIHPKKIEKWKLTKLLTESDSYHSSEISRTRKAKTKPSVTFIKTNSKENLKPATRKPKEQNNENQEQASEA